MGPFDLLRQPDINEGPESENVSLQQLDNRRHSRLFRKGGMIV